MKKQPRRKLSALRAHEVLTIAICVENRNHRFYLECASRFEGYDEEVCQILKEMAKQEDLHGEQLERIYREKFGNLEVSLTDQEIEEVIEVPIFDNVGVTAYDATTPAKCFSAALAAEVSARNFYKNLVALMEEKGLKETYKVLADFEIDHVKRIEQKMREYQKREKDIGFLREKGCS